MERLSIAPPWTPGFHPLRTLDGPQLRLTVEQPSSGIPRAAADCVGPTSRFAASQGSAYFELAKRYHPDRSNQNTHELMANINAARTIIWKCYRVD
jgi:hypothetical protein